MKTSFQLNLSREMVTVILAGLTWARDHGNNHEILDPFGEPIDTQDAIDLLEDVLECCEECNQPTTKLHEFTLRGYAAGPGGVVCEQEYPGTKTGTRPILLWSVTYQLCRECLDRKMGKRHSVLGAREPFD